MSGRPPRSQLPTLSHTVHDPAIPVRPRREMAIQCSYRYLQGMGTEYCGWIFFPPETEVGIDCTFFLVQRHISARQLALRQKKPGTLASLSPISGLATAGPASSGGTGCLAGLPQARGNAQSP